MRAASTNAKSAPLAPIPRASTPTAVAANVGLRDSWRAAKRRSCRKCSTNGRPARSRQASFVASTPPSFSDGLAPRLVQGQPRADVVVDVHLQVALDLRGQLALSPSARPAAGEPRQHRPQRPHDRSGRGDRKRSRMAVACSHSRVSRASCRRPAAGEPVELGLAVVVGEPPGRRDRALLLQLQQGGVDGPVVQREDVAARLLDPAGDPVPVQRPEALERLQHHQGQRPLPDVRLVAQERLLWVAHRKDATAPMGTQ